MQKKKYFDDDPQSENYHKWPNPDKLIDYDPSTGNFHKWPDPQNPRYQVVLIPKKDPKKDTKGNKAGGPGFLESKFALCGKEFVKTITVKSDMYFPSFDSKFKDKDPGKELRDSLRDAFSTVFEPPYFNETWRKYIESPNNNV